MTMCRSGPHHLVQPSTTKAPSSAAGNTVRCATEPVNLGCSGPSSISRTSECTPSAPTAASAPELLPFGRTDLRGWHSEALEKGTHTVAEDGLHISAGTCCAAMAADSRRQLRVNS